MVWLRRRGGFEFAAHLLRTVCICRTRFYMATFDFTTEAQRPQRQAINLQRLRVSVVRRSIILPRSFAITGAWASASGERSLTHNGDGQVQNAARRTQDRCYRGYAKVEQEFADNFGP